MVVGQLPAQPYKNLASSRPRGVYGNYILGPHTVEYYFIN